MWTVASIIPYVGNDITTVRGMAEVMDNLTHNTLPGFTRIAKTINETQLSNTNGQLDLQTIADMQDDFSSINNQLQKQRTTYDNLPTPPKSQSSLPHTGKDTTNSTPLRKPWTA